MSINRIDLYRGAIGILAVIGGMSALGGLYFIEVPAGNKEPLMLAIGLVLGWGSTVISHSFGSSKGSEDKTALLGKDA